jgi:hypothetical protein
MRYLVVWMALSIYGNCPIRLLIKAIYEQKEQPKLFDSVIVPTMLKL